MASARERHETSLHRAKSVRGRETDRQTDRQTDQIGVGGAVQQGLAESGNALFFTVGFIP